MYDTFANCNRLQRTATHGNTLFPAYDVRHFTFCWQVFGACLLMTNEGEKTAIHCNALQHTATRCNTHCKHNATHTATHCNTHYNAPPNAALLRRLLAQFQAVLLFLLPLPVLKCVAVCCSVVQCGAVCCSVLQCVTVCCSVFTISSGVAVPASTSCVEVCCSVLQCVAVWCSVLQCVAVCCKVLHFLTVCFSVFTISSGVAVPASTTCVAVCRSVL